jgi:anion-transporting  ArsA/GET3 family ATPase
LWAMMLDSQSAFDNLVTRIAPDSETLERILGNRVYRHVSETFAGNQEYMATEQLYDLVESGKYDLLILDTPPVENALDFLESSGRILRFLDEKILKWFLLPKSGKKGIGRRFFRTTKDVFFHLLGYLFGHEFLEELLEFFQDFTSLYKGFRARHLAVEALFLAKTTHFMTVCAPTSASLSIGGFFQKELGARGLGRAGIVINQIHPLLSKSHDAAAHFSNMGDHVDGEVIQLLGSAHEAAYNISQIQSQRVDTALDQYGEFGFLRRVEKRIGNVHNLEALYEVGDGIFGKMVSEK